MESSSNGRREAYPNPAARRLCYLRRETTFSPESATVLKKLNNLMEVFSALLREEMGRLFPPESVTGFKFKFQRRVEKY